MSLRRFAPESGRKTGRSGSLSSVFSNFCLLACGASRRRAEEKPGARFLCLLSSQISVFCLAALRVGERTKNRALGFSVFCLLKFLSSGLRRFAPESGRKTGCSVSLSSVFSNFCLLS
ncbi:MAG: hypothetical protein LBD06_11990, partial [Candidatus Accumulibacter sp.]|nr:hypothetical protein [Accumulibacter sp.]